MPMMDSIETIETAVTTSLTSASLNGSNAKRNGDSSDMGQDDVDDDDDGDDADDNDGLNVDGICIDVQLPITTSNGDGITAENPFCSVYDVISLIGEGHLTYCRYIDDLMRPMQRKLLEMPPDYNASVNYSTADDRKDSVNGSDENALTATSSATSSSASPTASNYSTSAMTMSDADEAALVRMSPDDTLLDDFDEQRAWLWQQCAIRITTAVQPVVEFAKRIPGFMQFTSDDQLILIKVGFYEVWLAQVTRLGLAGGRSADADRGAAALTFDDGCFVCASQLAKLYDVSFCRNSIFEQIFVKLRLWFFNFIPNKSSEEDGKNEILEIISFLNSYSELRLCRSIIEQQLEFGDSH